MVCRNCGADLKPGVKYCLECGNYIDDTDDDYQETNEVTGSYSTPKVKISAGKKRKKFNFSTTDYLIYGGLFLVFIVSIIVIIVTLIKDSSQPTVPDPVSPSPIEKVDKQVTIDNYSIVVPGKLDSTVQGSFLYASDNENYQFSFQIKAENFKNYYDNQARVKEQIIQNNHDVKSVLEKEVNSRLFLLYEIQADSGQKFLYFTQINSKSIALGSIEIFDSGNLQESLVDIDSICNSVIF